MKSYTISGVYESNDQPYTDAADAEDPIEAVRQLFDCESRIDRDDLMLVEVFSVTDSGEIVCELLFDELVSVADLLAANPVAEIPVTVGEHRGPKPVVDNVVVGNALPLPWDEEMLRMLKEREEDPAAVQSFPFPVEVSERDQMIAALQAWVNYEGDLTDMELPDVSALIRAALARATLGEEKRGPARLDLPPWADGAWFNDTPGNAYGNTKSIGKLNFGADE